MIETVWFLIFIAMLAFLFFGFGVYLEIIWLNFIAGFLLLITGLILFTTPIAGVSLYFNYGLGVILCMAGIFVALISVLTE